MPETALCEMWRKTTRGSPHTRSRRGIFLATTQHSVVHETAVVVPVKWNGKPINVMMNTGADPSVVDRGTVQKMDISYSTKYSQVYGLGRTVLAVCGTACVAIYVGDGRTLELMIMMIVFPEALNLILTFPPLKLTIQNTVPGLRLEKSLQSLKIFELQSLKNMLTKIVCV